MTTYTGHNLYRLLTALCLLLAALFGWQLINRWDWGALLFLGVALWSALRCFRLMASKVEIAADRVRVRVPGATPHEVEFRQFAAIYEEGRGLKSILLLYHPRRADGLFELDQELTLSLPAVNEHDALFQALTAQVKV